MKKFRDLPVYFIIIGLILNIIMYFLNQVSFISLMIRSSIIIVLFAAIGSFAAFVLNDAHATWYNNRGKRNISTSKIDIRVNVEEDINLLKIKPQSESEDFIEMNPEQFKTTS